MIRRIIGDAIWFSVTTALVTVFLWCTGISYAQDPGNNPALQKDTVKAKQVVNDLSVASLNPPEYFGKEQNIIPPSPTAASLGRYGEIPVTMYSGTPDIVIPLFELEGVKLILPVSMSYQATGVKVEEIPGWVGLGWALNAGGVITRTVNNLIDEQPSQGYIDYSDNIPLNFYSASCEFLRDIADGVINDTEPDVFFLNFPGFAGKFVFASDGEPRLIPFQKLEIKKQFGTLNSIYGITGFTVKTPDGTKYEFGGSGAVEVSSAQRPGPDQGSYFSSWYLSRIVSSDFKDTIRFTYTAHSYTSDPQINETMICESNCSVNWTCGSVTQSTTAVTIAALTLTSIESRKGKIVFSNASRADCNGGKKMTAMDIYSSGSGYPFRKYSFLYTDVASNPTATGYVGKRMFLDNISVKDSLNASIGKYTFSYYNRTSLPPRNSKAQDHWGFYNGATGNTSLIPASSTYGLSGANRQPGESYVKNGILERITYPTGGYTQFVYEAHKNASTLLCGGLRVKEIHDFDGVITTKKKYTYGTGYLFSSPVYEYTVEVDDGSGNFCNNLYRQSYSHSALGTSNGSYVGYPFVTELIGLTGEAGKTVRTYSHYFDQGSVSYPFSPGTTYDWARGNLLNEKHYSNNSGVFTLVEETVFTYSDISDNGPNSSSVKGLKVGYERYDPDWIVECTGVFSSQRYQEYYYPSIWFYLKEKTKKSYSAAGTVIENTKYYYANPTHAQITKETVTTSAGDSIGTFYYYPHDYGTIFQALTDSFIIDKPVDMRTYRNSQLSRGQQFEYNSYGLPVRVYEARIAAGGAIDFNSSDPYTFDPLIDISYNENYNIKEITPVNDHTTTFLWSYNDTYPVMKIENATYAQVSSLAGALISDLRIATSQTVISTKLSQIRSSLGPLSDSTQITCYKYRSHIGIAEEGDPNDLKTRYYYDKFGRLSFIKNNDNKILSLYLYNFINK